MHCPQPPKTPHCCDSFMSCNTFHHPAKHSAHLGCPHRASATAGERRRCIIASLHPLSPCHMPAAAVCTFEATSGNGEQQCQASAGGQGGRHREAGHREGGKWGRRERRRRGRLGAKGSRPAGGGAGEGGNGGRRGECQAGGVEAREGWAMVVARNLGVAGEERGGPAERACKAEGESRQGG